MLAISGTNVCGNPVARPINDRFTRTRKATGKSEYTLGTFTGDRAGEDFKARAIRFERVVTDDAEISLGLLIRDDEDNQIRIAYRARGGRNPLWKLVAIDRSRILERRTLS
jgi:hypothetical protein